MFARLYSVKYVPVVIAVHLTLLLCMHHFWYSPYTNASTPGMRQFGSGSAISLLNVDEVWLQPYDWNVTPGSHTAPKHSNSNESALWRFIAISPTSVHIKGYDVGYITWQQAIHWKQEDHLSIRTVILFDECPHSFNTITFGNIYKYYDCIATCATKLAKSFPGAALVYLAPTIPFRGRNNTTQQVDHPDQMQDNSAGELELLHWHLSQNFLVRQKGLIVANNRRALLYYSTLKGDNIKTFHEQDSHLRHKDSHKNGFMGDKLQTRTLRDIVLQINRIASSLEQKTSTFAKLVAHQHKNLFVVAQSLHSQCAKHYLTRKYDAQCHPPSSLTHPFLVTGLGGAGTHFAARQLRMQGWRVLHEDLDSDGAVVSVCVFL